MSDGVALVARLPRSEPAALFVPEGDPDGMDQWARVLLAAAGRFDDLEDGSRRLRQLDEWTGDSAEGYAGASDRARRHSAGLGDAAKRVARVLLATADRLREHQRDHADLVERKARLDQRLAALTSQAHATAGVLPVQSAALQQEADELAARFRGLVEDDQRLRRRVTADEDLLDQALRSATTSEDARAPEGGRPALAAEAMRRPGAPRADVSPAQVRRWWQELSAAERRAVTVSYAHWIADAEGVPQDARDRADAVRDEESELRRRARRADVEVA